ncbi:YicC/YloC family endoribonuclease [Marivibrio halodurans]|nr:YicC/YloC family endoribonuclease [Marivibrio halodurans]
MSTISSMTGFARMGGGDDRFHWVWEARSVNGKGHDLRLRLPNGWEALDPIAREKAKAFFARGNITVALDVKPIAGAGAMRINETFLAQLVARCEQAGESPRLDRLLQVRGVVESAEDGTAEAEEETDVEARRAAVAVTLEEALTALKAARKAEGARTAAVLNERLDEIATLTARAAETADAQPSAIRDRLARQIEELSEGRGGLDPERIAQEAAALAVKADVREELDRLTGHIEAARALLAEEAAIGRRFDFLCQEFNREANTLASKSAALTLTRIGLDLKAAIDQMREQVQNIE